MSTTTKKETKIQQSIFQQHKDDSDYEHAIDKSDSFGSEGYAFTPPKVDKLSHYLSMDIDKTILTDNSLDFWRRNQILVPVLSKLTRHIHYIPASSAAVE